MAAETASPDRVFLVGPMGAGKSTVGRQLAQRLGLEFRDADREIEHRCGVDIQTIFEFEGEAGFRRREAAMIDELTARDGVVVATGGGAVLDPASREHLATRGVTIYLAASVDEQLRRTRRGRGRPLLQQGDRRATLERLEAERDHLYRAVARVIVETDGRRSATTTERVLQRLRSPDPG